MKTMKRHGLEGRVVILRNKKLTFREIGNKLGVSGNYARKIYNKASSGA